MKKTVKLPIICILLLVISCIGAVCIGVSALASEGEPTTKSLQTYFISGSDDSKCDYSTKTTYPGRGVVATLFGSDYLTLRRVIDVRKMSKEKPLITVYPLAEKAGQTDYMVMYIDVVDAYDDSNYFTLSIKPYPGYENEYGACYSLAYASNGQNPTGMDRNGQYFHVNQWGTWTYLSLACNLSEIGNPEDNFLSLCYDESENAVYVRDKQGINHFVSDFDDMVYYGKNIWDGFTTGEVYCRVRLGDYMSASGSFLITQYGDVDLSEKWFVNENLPKISIDFNGYEENALPVAAVGKPYTIFHASATDLYYGDLSVETKVYTNYYSSSRTEVNIKSGSFTPRIPVEHYVVYTADGSSVEKTSVVVRIPIDKNYVEPTLNFVDFPTKWAFGEKASLPEYTAEGGSGIIDVKLTVVNGTLTLPTEDGFVQPLKLEPLVFTYTLTDYLGTEAVIRKTVDVERATKPYFDKIPILPDILIADVPYTLPSVKAYNYISANGAAVEVETSVIYKGTTTIVNGTYTPAVDNNKDTVTVRYAARVGNAVTTYEKEIPVYKVKTNGKLDMTKYFETTGTASLSATKQSINLTGSGTTDFTFINAVGVNNFKTDFITGDTTKLDRLDIILTDTVNPDNTLKFTYKKKGSSIVFFVNDNEEGALPVSALFSNKSIMGLSLDLYKNEAYYDVNSNLYAYIKTNLAGDQFTGFTYDKANICYHMEGSDYTIGLQTINNQFLSNDSMDYTGPYLDVNGDYGGETIKHDSIVIPSVLATDVLTGDAYVYVSVQKPNGEYLYENVLLSTVTDSIILTEFGGYYVEITAKDGYGRTSTFSYVITVIDDQAPVFGPIAEISDTTVGKKVVIPRPTATDNIDGTVEVKRYICYPGGQFKLLGTYDGIVVKSVGTYTVVFVATDSFGNRTTAIRTFEVN